MKLSEENKNISIAPDLMAKAQYKIRDRIFVFIILAGMLSEARLGGLIDYEFFRLIRGLYIDYAIALCLLMYLFFFKFGILFKYVKSNIVKLIIILNLFLFLELFYSYLEYDINPFIVFIKKLPLFLSALIFLYLYVFEKNLFPLLLKYVYYCSLFLSIVYVLQVLAGLLGSYNIEMEGYGRLVVDIRGITIVRVWANTMGSEIFFIYNLLKILREKVRPILFIHTIIFIMPTILAFGRQAWLIMLLSSVLALFYALKGTTKSVLFLKVSVFIGSIILFLFLYSDYTKTDYFQAINYRLTMSSEDYEYNEGTFGIRAEVQTPVLLNYWAKNPVMGFGFYPYWLEGKDWVLYSGMTDVSAPALLAAFGVVGFSLFLLISYSFFYISLLIYKKNYFKDFYIIAVSIVYMSSVVVKNFTLIKLSNFDLNGFNFTVTFYITYLLYNYFKYKKEFQETNIQ